MSETNLLTRLNQNIAATGMYGASQCRAVLDKAVSRRIMPRRAARCRKIPYGFARLIQYGAERCHAMSYGTANCRAVPCTSARFRMYRAAPCRAIL